jgi:hypothetical protein
MRKSKSEIRNPKSQTNSKSEIPNSKPSRIRVWNFGFVSDFGFRISNLFKNRAGDGPALLRGMSVLVVSMLCVVGCTQSNKPATTQPMSWADQEQADPANFNPQMNDPNISGGDIGHFDKNAFDKDVNDVLNP